MGRGFGRIAPAPALRRGDPGQDHHGSRRLRCHPFRLRRAEWSVGSGVTQARGAIIRHVSFDWFRLLDWLRSLDWLHLDAVFGALASATVLAGIVWAAIQFIWKPLFEWLGRRRAQAKLLDKLACGSSVEFVESLFGVAQFISTEDRREQRTYRLRGAWVMIEIENDSVYAFSITVTSRWMHYKIKRLTFGFLRVKLGKTKFGDHSIGFNGERYWGGARRNGYLRNYTFGNPGGYQNYWLSHNMSGAGVLTPPKDETGMLVETGVFCADIEAPNRFNLANGIDASGITINTCWDRRVQSSSSRPVTFSGPDESRVRLALNIKHPTSRTQWQQLQVRSFRARYALGKPFRAIKRNAK